MSAPDLIASSVVGGKYTIRSLLLHGGTTATYRASAPQNSEVALKVYDPAILTFPHVLKTLSQHKAISAKLPSQQILPVIDSGTDPNSGAPFTVTEFETRPSLSQLIDRGPLSASAVVALVRNLAGAIDLLHSSGITSLSLHPGNIFVSASSQYEVRIADFGASLVRTVLPAPEKVVRWMPWLAPEQIKGQPPPSQTADTFALGLLAFFAVTGKPYWRSSNLMAKDTAPLRREILGERMPASVRASEFSITLNPAVDAVFTRALAFRPAERFATARELAAALEAALLGRSVAEASVERPATATARAATPTAESSEPRGELPSSSGDPSSSSRRQAPAPRKMPQRSTMLGMGNQAPEARAPTAAGARPPMSTMLGMGEAAAQAVAAASANVAAQPSPPAKAAAPASPASPMKAAPPPMPAGPATGLLKSTVLGMAPPMTAAASKPGAPAKAGPAALPATPAYAAPAAKAAAPAPTPALALDLSDDLPTMVMASPLERAAPPPMPASSPERAAPPPMPVASPQRAAPPPMPVASPERAAPPQMPMTTPDRAGPPPMPMAPPPDQITQMLAQFEASAPVHQPVVAANAVASSAGGSDVAQSAPAWSMAEHSEPGRERVETGVAVLGAPLTDPPKRSRVGWIAGVCVVLVAAGGGALALAGGGSSGAPVRTDSKVTGAGPTIAAEAPTSLEPSGAPTQPEAPHAAKRTEEAHAGAAVEPAAPAPPPTPPPVEQPRAPEPAAAATPPPAPTEDRPPSATQGRSAPTPTWTPPPAPVGARTQPAAPPSKKPCGKFLKRCN